MEMLSVHIRKVLEIFRPHKILIKFEKGSDLFLRFFLQGGCVIVGLLKGRKVGRLNFLSIGPNAKYRLVFFVRSFPTSGAARYLFGEIREREKSFAVRLAAKFFEQRVKSGSKKQAKTKFGTFGEKKFKKLGIYGWSCWDVCGCVGAEETEKPCWEFYYFFFP